MKSRLFDHIYLVNLSRHRGRRLKSLAHLSSFGIKPTVFEATDGYIPPILPQYEVYKNTKLGSLAYFSEFNEVEINRKNHFIESAGAFGCINTFIRILEDAKSKEYESILIFEDDIFLSTDFNGRLKEFYSKLPETWKFIGLGASQYNWESVNLKNISEKGYYRPKQLDTCGAFAIAIRHTVFDELIALQSHYEAPIDHLPLGEIYNNYTSDCFIAYPNMVMPDVRSSSIRGSRNQLLHAEKMKWDVDLFGYPEKRPIINLILTSKEQTKYYHSFSDENTFPFELHVFISSIDGLRPYHDASQAMETAAETDLIVSPNSGYCIGFVDSKPFTEDALLSLYESLVLDKVLPEEFKRIETIAHDIDSERVSVIIPTFKRSKNIEKTLLSVIEQDYVNKEIIIVDDNPRGSEEQINTEKVVSRLIDENKYTNLIYISQSKNRNGAAARNTGFLASTGNYICYLDDDDQYLPGRLSLSIDKLKNSPRNVGAVYCGFIGWNSTNNEKDRYNRSNLTQELLSLDFLTHYLHTNTATYKREAVITINGFDETFLRHQDLEFNLRFFEYYQMSVVKKQLVSLRPEPISNNNRQFGVSLFQTKLKFLEKFQYIINRYEPAIQKLIYNNHWAEVVVNTPSENLLKEYLFSDYSNGHLQCFSLLKKEDNTKQKVEKKAKQEVKPELEQPTIDDRVEILLEMEKVAFNNLSIEELDSWQLKGANAFGFAFGKFILPHHKIKLKERPKAFFEDSNNKFARFVGRLLKII